MSNKKGRSSSDPEKRFWSFVDKANDCWLWTAALTSSGYGSFYFRGKNRAASRVSWIIHRGEIPEGKIVCHTCDVRRCVRIDHLWLGTTRENQEDAARKGRFPKGEKSHAAKVTDAQRNEILKLWMKGLNRVQIGERYNITQQAVHHIIKTLKNTLDNPRKNEIYKKLNPEIHQEILERFNKGETQRSLSKEYGIAPSTMGWIIRHKFKDKARK